MTSATFVQAFEEGIVVDVTIDASSAHTPASGEKISIPGQFNDVSGHVLPSGFYFLSKGTSLEFTYDGTSAAYKGQFKVQQDSYMKNASDSINELQYGAEYSLRLGTNSTVNATSDNLFLASKLQNPKVTKIIEGNNKLEARVEFDLASMNAFNRVLATSGMQVSLENVTDESSGSATFTLGSGDVTYEANASATKGVISVLISGTDANGDNKVFNDNKYIVSISIGNRMGLTDLTQTDGDGKPVVVEPEPTPNGLTFTNYDSVLGLLTFTLDAEVDASASYTAMKVDFQFSMNGSAVGTQTLNLVKAASLANSYPTNDTANNVRTVTVDSGIINKLKVAGYVEEFTVTGTVTGTIVTTVTDDEGNSTDVSEHLTSNDVASENYYQEGGLKVDSFTLESVDFMPEDGNGNFQSATWGNQNFKVVVDGSYNETSLEVSFDLSGVEYATNWNDQDNGIVISTEDNKTIIDLTLTYGQVVLGDGQQLLVNVSRSELNNASNTRVGIVTDGTKAADASGNLVFRNNNNTNAIPIYALRGPGKPAISFVEPTLGVGSEKTTASVTFEKWTDQDNTAGTGIQQLDSSSSIYYGAEIKETSTSLDALYDVKLSTAKVSVLTEDDLVFEFKNVYTAGTKYTLAGFGYKKISEILFGKNSNSITMYKALNILGEQLNNNTDNLPGIYTSTSTVFKGQPKIDSVVPVPLNCNSLKLNALRIKGDMNANVMNKILALAMDASGRILEREFMIDASTVDIGNNPMTGDGSGDFADTVAGEFTFIADMSGSSLSVDQQLGNIEIEIDVSNNVFLFALADTDNFLDGYKLENNKTISDNNSALLFDSIYFQEAAKKYVDTSASFAQAIIDAGTNDENEANYLSQQWYIDKQGEINAYDTSISDISLAIQQAEQTLEGNSATTGSDAALAQAKQELADSTTAITTAELNEKLYKSFVGYWKEIVEWIDNSGSGGYGTGDVAKPADALEIFGGLNVPGLNISINDMGPYMRNTGNNAYADYVLQNRRRLLNVHTMIFYKPLLAASVYASQSTLSTLKGEIVGIKNEDIPAEGTGSVFEKITWTEAEMKSPNENITVLEADKTTYSTAVTTAETGRSAKYQEVDTQTAANEALKKSIESNKEKNATLNENKKTAQEGLNKIIEGLGQAQSDASSAFIQAEEELLNARRLFFDYDNSNNCIGHKGMGPQGSDEDGIMP
jgi:hypothetical protein